MSDENNATEPAKKPKGRIIQDPTLIALADIIDIFETIPAGRRAWAFEHLAAVYGSVPTLQPLTREQLQKLLGNGVGA